MDVNLTAFREPRGVMRILHFIFAICAFATITAYSGWINLFCDKISAKKTFDYPFSLYYPNITVGNSCRTDLMGDYSSDAKYFVATGVLAMLYSLAISIIYVKFDAQYKSNNRIPLLDFVITVIFGVLWLSSSAAWANGLTGLKSITDIKDCNTCKITTSSFSSLNISVIFGFLNFFLWAADLWFLYKETAWFQGNQQQTSGL